MMLPRKISLNVEVQISPGFVPAPFTQLCRSLLAFFFFPSLGISQYSHRDYEMAQALTSTEKLIREEGSRAGRCG